MNWRLPARPSVVGMAALILALIVGRLLGLWPTVAPAEPCSGVYRVQEVIDGDTLRLANGARIRLIGVDAPEPQGPHGQPEPWAAEATQFLREAVASTGGEVRLEFDWVTKDRYGRFLAYLYVGEMRSTRNWSAGAGPQSYRIRLFLGDESPIPTGRTRSTKSPTGNLERFPLATSPPPDSPAAG